MALIRLATQYGRYGYRKLTELLHVEGWPLSAACYAIACRAVVGIKPIRIYPGSPWEKGYKERFNGTRRREVLDAEWFTTTQQAQIVINHWLKQYNHTRPHQALNTRRPVPETN